MNHHRIRTGLTAIAAAAGLILGASLVGPDVAYAGSDEGRGTKPAHGVEARIERMAKDLDLTEAQQAEVRKIMETEQSQRDLQRQETRKQINTVLTEVQKAKRDDMAQARMDRDLDRVPDRFDLSDAQVAQIKALFDEQQTNPELTRPQLRERIAAVLTDEQRASVKDRKHPDCDK